MTILMQDILTDIANTHGLKVFLNKKFCSETLSAYLNTKYKNEAKLLIRITKAGYISNIVKSNKDREIIQRQLYEDESIDKEIAMKLVDVLFDVINTAKIREVARKKEIKKENLIAEKKEREQKDQKMVEILESSLIKIIKSHGRNILDDYNICRALLKDTTNGDYVDEITIISILFEKNIQNDKQLKRKLFRKSLKELVEIYSEMFFKNSDVDNNVKSLIQMTIRIIWKIESSDNESERGLKKWITNSRKLSRK